MRPVAVGATSCLFALLAAAGIARAQDRGTRPSLEANPASGELHLDGRLDEPAWLAADSIAHLTEVEPIAGGTPRMRTVVKVLVSRDALTIGVVAYDAEPAHIVSFAKAPDASLNSEDHIKLVLDTFMDGRSGYIFAVNPNGARYDALVTNQGEEENKNWDAVWQAAAARGPDGWSVEIRIPIKSLAFNPGLTAWGFNIERRVQRLQETDRWASPQRDFQIGQSSRAGSITGLPHFDLGIGLSMRPALTSGAGVVAPGARVDKTVHPSLDVTQRLGANLLGSLTFNTDFAETEVDTRRTNLTRFPLFFSEKRTFFLEGSDIFDFGLGLSSDDVVPFFSRRIGLVAGQTVPLRVGGKLNGRVGGTNIGALLARTGNSDTLAVAATMGVVRVKQNLLEESSAGFIATVGDPLGRRDSWMFGPDFRYQTSRFHGDKNLLAGVWGLATNRDDLRGDRTAAGLQMSYPNDLWDMSLSYRRIGDNFQPSLGFVPRPGVQMVSAAVNFQPRPKRLGIRQCFFENELSLVTGLHGGWQSYEYFMAPVNCRFESGDRLEMNIAPHGERLVEPFDVADGVVIGPGTYEFRRYRIEAGLAAKRRFSGQFTWWFGSWYSGKLDQIEVTSTWNPSSTIMVELNGERDIGRFATGRFANDVVGARVNLNLSPDLQASSFLQYDTESASFGTNTRARWTFSPLGTLFIVYNHNLRDRFDRWSFDSNQLLIKAQYTLRY